MTKKELIRELEKFGDDDEVFGCVNIDEGMIHEPIHTVGEVDRGQIGLFLNMYWITQEMIEQVPM